ncbi:MAG: M23 family metallopeptidase [Candidatus Corynebacterium faecigallinarum]|uniref:M23 family metallopeptidase n=2 Tax=Corynebacteriaceae TaxID=1653 RepID=UPI002648DF93|nr:M23 family metallopeptidase [Corynebacterium sp.]MDN5724110.1 M23 family metallopeptidase [Corynebacterium sp.]MDN6282752.1 M23 family metallopeptidase [Corynebacterium sp.]MDN6354007.1 M23 family metallopeptidase [Corynebacterium sp.]MDN6368278.1 M23 family metallopeptidase [Corynebacterium sp.]MDN6375933.1 M23 family metallopeptidase [Corynebacterium sp.]
MTEVRKVGAHRKLDTAAKRRMAFVAMAATGVAAAGATGAGAATVQSDDKGSDIALTSNTEVLAQGAGGSAPGGDIADSAAQILDLPQVTQISELGNQLSSALEFDAARAAEDLLNRTPSTVKPAEGSFTSGYAMRWGTMHKGIDIANGIGTPIAAAQSGTVIDAGPASGFGNWVRIKHSDGTVTVYGHMSTIDVTVGQQVQAGQKIAGIGNEGFSTGPHVHFEVYPTEGQAVDPVPWLRERGVEV